MSRTFLKRKSTRHTCRVDLIDKKTGSAVENQRQVQELIRSRQGREPIYRTIVCVFGNIVPGRAGQDGIAFGSGILTTRTWRALGCPNIFTGDQTVPAGATLTVEPGVTVTADGDYLIAVYGRLEAV
ncbi:MAG TPA: hypothetical protein VN363_10390, partial [Anaerolineales bacterium]|nr:hypothetical protein [Anaerolineales bacterium]